MAKVAGRNDPCPCGSGRKYKRCCLDPTSRSPARQARVSMNGGSLGYSFEPGSYGVGVGFLPSLAAYQEVADGGREIAFVLVKSEATPESESQAGLRAMRDFGAAKEVYRRTGSSDDLACHLADLGYENLKGFRINPDAARASTLAVLDVE